MFVICHKINYTGTVEPLYNGHLGDRRKWPFPTPPLKKMAVVERWPLVEVLL